LQDAVGDLNDLGATLVAITPQLPEKSRELIEKHNISFEMLSDKGNAYIEELGIKFELSPEVKKIYAGGGIDLLATNGDDSWTLPMPARLVVDTSGIVRAADIDPNYGQRPEPEKTIADVKALG